PGSSVSPSASRVSPSSPFRIRNGTAFARASRAVISVSTPPTVKASTPMLAPLRKTRRSMAFMDPSRISPTQKALHYSDRRRMSDREGANQAHQAHVELRHKSFMGGRPKFRDFNGLGKQKLFSPITTMFLQHGAVSRWYGVSLSSASRRRPRF